MCIYIYKDFFSATLGSAFSSKTHWRRRGKTLPPHRWTDMNSSVKHTSLADILTPCLIEKHAPFIGSNRVNSHLSCWQACDRMYDDQSCSQRAIIHLLLTEQSLEEGYKGQKQASYTTWKSFFSIYGLFCTKNWASYWEVSSLIASGPYISGGKKRQSDTKRKRQLAC